MVLATALELSAPSFDGITGSLSFTARDLGSLPDFYAGPGTPQTVSGNFGAASLFIDDASPAASQTAVIVLDFTELPAKNPVSVTLQTPASFVLGEHLNVEAISPPATPVSLDQLEVSGSRILVNPGDVTSFKLTLSVLVPQSTTSLSGTVSIGAGSVTIGQLGSSDFETISASGNFSIELDL
jgi:hypothetical protein